MTFHFYGGYFYALYHIISNFRNLKFRDIYDSWLFYESKVSNLLIEFILQEKYVIKLL